MDPTVLIVLTAPPRPTETFILQDIELLAARGVRLVVATLHEGEAEALRALPGVQVVCCRPPPRPGSRSVFGRSRIALHRLWARAAPGGIQQWVTERRHSEAVRQISELILTSGARHAHAEFADVAAVAARAAALRSKVSFSVGLHARDVFVLRYNPRRLFGSARRLFFCNDAARRFLTVRWPPAAMKSVLYYHGVRLREWPFVPRNPDFRREEKGGARGLRLLFVGRLVEKKGLPILLRAMAQAGEAAASLDVLGDGPDRIGWQRLARRLGIADRIVWNGMVRRADVRRALQNADVLVAPSVIAADGDRDGIPNVVVEAMASGTPVIAGDVGGLSEIVHDETGYSVPAGDPGALAEALRAVHREPEIAVQKAAAARRLVEEQFDAERLADERAAEFRRLCESGDA